LDSAPMKVMTLMPLEAMQKRRYSMERMIASFEHF
jgi:hypothetical protein